MRWKQATEEQIEGGLQVIEIGNHEGHWFEQPDFWSKYLRRPDSLRSICFAQFAKMYEGSHAKSRDDDDNDEEVAPEEVEADEEEKFHFIMSYRNESKIPLPTIIHLRNPKPGETPCMRKRSYPAALRYHKIKDFESIRYMLNEIMLYRPVFK